MVVNKDSISSTSNCSLTNRTIKKIKILYYKFLQHYKPGLIEKYNRLYNNNFYTGYQYQDDLKYKADKLCKKYNIRSSIL